MGKKVYLEVALSKIEPNPHRNLPNYPIDRDRVDAIKESIERNGFQAALNARPTKSGKKYQIAFGHHRLIAARESKLKTIPLIIEELSEDQMIHHMADENFQRWGSSAIADQDTVRAVVRAFKAGEIELPDVSKDAKDVRIAPSYRKQRVGPECSGPVYTAVSLAQYLGWLNPSGRPSERVEAALRSLENIELKVMSEEDYRELKPTQAKRVDREVAKATERRLQRERTKQRRKGKKPVITKEMKEEARKDAARKVGKPLAKKLADERISTGQITQEAFKLDEVKKEKEYPDIRAGCVRVSDQIATILHVELDKTDLTKKVLEIAENKEDVPGPSLSLVTDSLEYLRERIDSQLESLRVETKLKQRTVPAKSRRPKRLVGVADKG